MVRGALNRSNELELNGMDPPSFEVNRISVKGSCVARLDRTRLACRDRGMSPRAIQFSLAKLDSAQRDDEPARFITGIEGRPLPLEFGAHVIDFAFITGIEQDRANGALAGLDVQFIKGLGSDENALPLGSILRTGDYVNRDNPQSRLGPKLEW